MPANSIALSTHGGFKYCTLLELARVHAATDQPEFHNPNDDRRAVINLAISLKRHLTGARGNLPPRPSSVGEGATGVLEVCGKDARRASTPA
jgi:hypothetical protein